MRRIPAKPTKSEMAIPARIYVTQGWGPTVSALAKRALRAEWENQVMRDALYWIGDPHAEHMEDSRIYESMAACALRGVEKEPK